MTIFGVTGEKCKSCGHSDENHWKDACHFQQHGARLTCDCTVFMSPTVDAIRSLPWDEQRLLACACFLGIDPDYITEIENVTVGQEKGQFGFKVSIHIDAGNGSLREWVAKNLPKCRTAATTAYLANRAEIKKE